MTLPCGRCRGKTWMVYQLVLGTARRVSVEPMPEFEDQVRRIVIETP